MKQIQKTYSDSNPHPAWKEGWVSKARKYHPIEDFSEFECITEITEWEKVPYHVPSHTYVLNRAGNCCGYFVRNKIDKENWIEFHRPSTQFSKSRRKFKKVKITTI